MNTDQFGLGLSASLKNEPVCQTISSLIVCRVTGGQWSCCIGLTGLNQLVQKQHQVHRVILAMWTVATFRPEIECSEFAEVSGELKCHILWLFTFSSKFISFN